MAALIEFRGRILVGIAVFAISIQGSVAQPLLPVGQLYSPICGPNFPPSASNPAAWSPWSSPSTWPGGIVPTSGDVTIGCGRYVLLDVSGLVLNRLNISGGLLVSDSPATGNINLSANFIFVLGYFFAGTPTQHYRQKFTITLTTPASGVTFDPAFPSAGFKCVVVIGGQVQFFGMPGGGGTIAWGRLSGTARVGANSITLDTTPTGWPIGEQIVIASTDFDGWQSEVVRITNITGNVVVINRPLVYEHYGFPVYTGVPGRFMIQSAEVALLSRNIVIQGAQEADTLIGGHFMVFQTATPQLVIGVQFSNMGQQGNLGRYPCHMHMCLDQPFTTIAKCLVRDSQQRGYVTHGTNYLTWQENVSWNTIGHVFFIEDGLEVGNRFINNLGIGSARPQILLSKIVNGAPRLENDDRPTIFWASNPNNTWIRNAAVGATLGFWFSLDFFITGPSVNLTGANGYYPIYTPLGVFDNNLAHSNTDGGLIMYRDGYRPIYNAIFSRFQAYKNDYQGVQFHGSTQLQLVDSIIADSTQTVDMFSFSASGVRNTILMGYTDNLGNPFFCNTIYACVPVGGCPAGFSFQTVPARPGPGWRTVAPTIQSEFRLGVNVAANTVSNTTFVNFDTQNCFQGGGIGWDNRQGFFIPVSSRVNTTKWVNSNNARFNTTGFKSGDFPITFIMFDQDGSVSGTGLPTFMVPASNPNILPPPTVQTTNCRYNASWAAYACANVCYRSVKLEFDQPGSFIPNVIPAQVAYLIITRPFDGAVQIVQQYFPPPPQQNADGSITFSRTFEFSLNTGYTYFITFGNMTGTPKQYWLSYADQSTYFIPGTSYPTPPGPPCSANVAIALPAPSPAVTAFSVPETSHIPLPANNAGPTAQDTQPSVHQTWAVDTSPISTVNAGPTAQDTQPGVGQTWAVERSRILADIASGAVALAEFGAPSVEPQVVAFAPAHSAENPSSGRPLTALSPTESLSGDLAPAGVAPESFSGDLAHAAVATENLPRDLALAPPGTPWPAERSPASDAERVEVYGAEGMVGRVGPGVTYPITLSLAQQVGTSDAHVFREVATRYADAVFGPPRVPGNVLGPEGLPDAYNITRPFDEYPSPPPFPAGLLPIGAGTG